MYLSYNLQKNDKLKYARLAARAEQRTTYYLTYGLINLCVILMVLSFCFYYFSTPITIEHVNIPPRDDLGIFFITLFVTALLCLVAFHFRRQFNFLFQLALIKTNYTRVEIWADAKQLRCKLDKKEYIFEWKNMMIKSDHYQTCLTYDNKRSCQDSPLLLIPNQYVSKTNLVSSMHQWQKSFA